MPRIIWTGLEEAFKSGREREFGTGAGIYGEGSGANRIASGHATFRMTIITYSEAGLCFHAVAPSRSRSLRPRGIHPTLARGTHD